MKASLTFFLALITQSWLSTPARAGQTQCISSELDWYTDSVGETPCRTYERLQQICNPLYNVPHFNVSLPGNRCDSDISSLCCCNSVAWALSMLCYNCQRCENGPACYDAAQGSYQRYLQQDGSDGGICRFGTNQTIVPETQVKACDAGINIPEQLYELFWHKGDWYYAFTKKTIQQMPEMSSATRCLHFPSSSFSITPTSTNPASASSVATESSSPGSSSSSSNHAGVIVGGVLGGLIGIAGLLALVWFLTRWRENHQRYKRHHVVQSHAPSDGILAMSLPPAPKPQPHFLPQQESGRGYPSVFLGRSSDANMYPASAYSVDHDYESMRDVR